MFHMSALISALQSETGHPDRGPSLSVQTGTGSSQSCAAVALIVTVKPVVMSQYHVSSPFYRRINRVRCRCRVVDSWWLNAIRTSASTHNLGVGAVNRHDSEDHMSIGSRPPEAWNSLDCTWSSKTRTKPVAKAASPGSAPTLTCE